MKLKIILLIILEVVLIPLIVYLIFAFVKVDLSIMEWDISERLSIAIITLFLVGLAIIATVTYKEDQNEISRCKYNRDR